jgi:hypothetical protein
VSEHAHGSKGTVNISGGRIQGNGGKFQDVEEWRYRGPKANAYQVEHDDLFAAIRKGAAYNEAEYGAHSTMTSILGRMATYSGKEIGWEEAINTEVSVGDVGKFHSFKDTPPVLPDENGRYAIPVPGVTKVI